MPRNSRRRPPHEAGKQNMGPGRWSATNGRCGKKHAGRDRRGSMRRPPQDSHGDSHQVPLLDLELSGEIPSRFLRAQPPITKQILKISFCMQFERGVPYFWWRGPRNFAGSLASRENYLPTAIPKKPAENAFCKICTASSLCLAGGPCFYSGWAAPLFSH